jgi:hypothetical protein
MLSVLIGYHQYRRHGRQFINTKRRLTFSSHDEFVFCFVEAAVEAVAE